MYFIAYNKKRIKNVGNSYLKNGKGVVFIKSFRSFFLSCFCEIIAIAHVSSRDFFSLILNIFFFIHFILTHQSDISFHFQFMERTKTTTTTESILLLLNKFIIFTLFSMNSTESTHHKAHHPKEETSRHVGPQVP